MKRLGLISDFSPALVFFSIAVFFAIKIWIGSSPSNPFAWWAFLSVPAIVREPTNFLYYGVGISATTGTWAFLAMGVVGIPIALSRAWLRFRFLYFHAALLALVPNYLGIRIPLAPENQSTDQLIASLLSEMSQFGGLSVAILIILVVCCLDSHRRVLFRSPSRSHHAIPSAAATFAATVNSTCSSALGQLVRSVRATTRQLIGFGVEKTALTSG